MKKTPITLFIAFLSFSVNAEIVQVMLQFEKNTKSDMPKCEIVINEKESVKTLTNKHLITKTQYGSYYTKASRTAIQGHKDNSGMYYSSCNVKLTQYDFIKSLKFCSLSSHSQTSMSRSIYRHQANYKSENCSILPINDGFSFTQTQRSDEKEKSMYPKMCTYLCLVE